MDSAPDNTAFEISGPAAIISRRQNILAAAVKDETLMMDMKHGQYYGLDDIGTAIWDFLETPRSFAELVRFLTAEYNGTPEVIAADVRAFLADLSDHGIVTVSLQNG
jgi:AAA ATPase containing von Willebrand factor type A (vWA) domain